MKKLLIARGCPGSGKTYQVQRLASSSREAGLHVAICSADDFFLGPGGEYVFDANLLGLAHALCRRQCENALCLETEIVLIDNTNTTAKECRFYVERALIHGYEIGFLEPTTSWAFDAEELTRRNVHGVPREAIDRMLARWVPEMTIEKALGNKE